MKARFSIFIFFTLCLLSLVSCLKQEYFKSEKEIKKDLQGTWKLFPIPKYDSIINPDLTRGVIEHFETWTFDDTKVTIVDYNQTGISTYSINTSISKAEFKLDGIIPGLVLPARPRSNGTWQIVKLDGNNLYISSDQDGTSGLIQLEFQK